MIDKTEDIEEILREEAELEERCLKWLLSRKLGSTFKDNEETIPPSSIKNEMVLIGKGM